GLRERERGSDERGRIYMENAPAVLGRQSARHVGCVSRMSVEGDDVLPGDGASRTDDPVSRRCGLDACSVRQTGCDHQQRDDGYADDRAFPVAVCELLAEVAHPGTIPVWLARSTPRFAEPLTMAGERRLNISARRSTAVDLKGRQSCVDSASREG